MRTIQISSIGYVHGERRRVADLQDEAPSDLSPLIAEVRCYRASLIDIWELGATAAKQTLAASATLPDLLVYVSENDLDQSWSLARITEQLDVPTIEYVSVSGHDCGNLGPSLRVASDALHSESCDRVLVILADCAPQGRRIMTNGMSVFSDGAASCIVTREVEENSQPRFEVEAIATRTRVQLDALPAADRTILSTVQLAASSVADILQSTQRERSEFRYVLFGNYRPTSQEFLAAAMGFSADKLLLGPITEYGHSFSADILVTLERYSAAGALGPGDCVLASAIGPYSWSTLAIRCV